MRADEYFSFFSKLSKFAAVYSRQ